MEDPAFPWHILLVPLPLGFLLAGVLFDLAKHTDEHQHRWLFPASNALLWGGTGVLMITAATGFLTPGGRFVDLPSIPFAQHRFLGLWTTGLFVILSIWRWKSRHGSALFSLIWMASTVTLLATAWLGWNVGHRIDVGKNFFQ